jgi:hypothetical protein
LPRRKQARDISALLPNFVQKFKKVLVKKKRYAFLPVRNFAVAKISTAMRGRWTELCKPRYL